MNTVYVDKKIINDELSKLLETYSDRIEIKVYDESNYKHIKMSKCIQIFSDIKFINKGAKIHILLKGDDFVLGYKHKNTNILFVNRVSEIDDILRFYLEYDYKTLKGKI